MFSVRDGAIAAINCTQRCNTYTKLVPASWSICARKDEGSDWPQKFAPTNFRRRDSTRSKQTKSWGSRWISLNIVEQLPIKAQANPHNARYLQTKRAKMGHLL